MPPAQIHIDFKLTDLASALSVPPPPAFCSLRSSQVSPHPSPAVSNNDSSGRTYPKSRYTLPAEGCRTGIELKKGWVAERERLAAENKTWKGGRI